MKKLFAFGIFAISTIALGEVHTYTIPRIGGTGEQCQKVESWVVDRFAKLTDTAVLTHGCERNPYRTFDLLIEYSSPVAANLVTTFDNYGYVNALYETSAECAAHIEEDFAVFRDATGLEPLLGYCIEDRRDQAIHNGWALRIDGFGKPKLEPQHIARDFYNGANDDVLSLEKGLKDTLEAYGAQHTKVRIRSNPNRTIIHAMYYSDKKLPLMQFSEGHFKSIEACESYRDDMREVFARAGGQSAIFFCGPSDLSSAVYIYSAGVVMQPLATELTALKYSTFEACEAKRAETEASWRDGLSKNVVGSMCAVEDAVTYENVRMRMFWLE